MNTYIVTEHGYFRAILPSLDEAVKWAKDRSGLSTSDALPKKLDVTRWDRAPEAAWSLVLDIVPSQDQPPDDFWSFVIEEYKVK